MKRGNTMEKDEVVTNKLSEMNLNNYRPLREVIFDSLRNAIIMGELRPGERLMEIQFAKKMGVSRTPVREAIRKLELEGLVVMMPRKGAYVADLSTKDIMDVLEVRSAMDGLASALAAKRATKDEIKSLGNVIKQFEQYMEENNVKGLIEKDIEFHEIIYIASRNEKILQIATNLKDQIHRFRVVYLKDYSSTKGLVKEHNEIYQAIKDGNEEQARNLADTHIKHQKMIMIASLEKSR